MAGDTSASANIMAKAPARPAPCINPAIIFHPQRFMQFE